MNRKKINAELIDIGKLDTSRKNRAKFRILVFRNLNAEDAETYHLCMFIGKPQYNEFARLRVGNKVSNLIVYKDKQRNYVDYKSQFTLIKARPLF